MQDKKLVLTWIGLVMLTCWLSLFISLLSIPNLYEIYIGIKHIIPVKFYDVCLLLYLIIMTIFIFSPLLENRIFRVVLGMLIFEYISLWWLYIFDSSGLIFKFRGQFIHTLYFIYIHTTHLFFIFCLLFEAIKSIKYWKR